MIREKTILSSLVVVSLLYFSHLTREFIHKVPDLIMARKNIIGVFILTYGSTLL